MNDDESYTMFAKGMIIYFICTILAVPVGLGLAQLIKYCTG